MAISEIQRSSPLSQAIFGRDASSLQAQEIGTQSGVSLTEQAQVDLYRRLRDERLESGQVIYAEVLRETGGPVEIFREAYPHIFKRS